MEKIVFTCKTITPLVMNGAYGDYPELRPPGIKASLRFWWRALHGHLSIEDEKNQDGSIRNKGLRTLEGEIFGSTTSRSKILIRVDQSIQTNPIRTSLLPHKGGSPAAAFEPNSEFKIRLDCERNQKEMLKNLFILACTLGGWGKRSRRGFGSIIIEEIYINGVKDEGFTMPQNTGDIYELLPKNYFDHSAGVITSKFGKDENYPYLKSIQIGNSQKSTTDIGRFTHDVMSEREPQKLNYKYVLGAGSPRFASPIVVSNLGNGLPIVTTLKRVSPRIIKRDEERGAITDTQLQTEFKKLLLDQ